MDPNEARKKLEQVLDEKLKLQYFAYLRQWILFSPTLTREQFDEKVRGIFYNEQQFQCHDNFLCALLNKVILGDVSQPIKQSAFEAANYADYVKPKQTHHTTPLNYTYPRAAAELFVPYSGFISCRISIVAWECGMEGAEKEVTQLVVHACQTFLKNIITAMITKAKSYKVRDGKFQYGFNTPIADPFVRNSNKLWDESMESNVALKEDLLIPKGKKSMERMEHDLSFTYATNKKIKSNVTLDTHLLYETIRENPSLFGQHSLHRVHALKLSLYKDYKLSASGDEDDSDE